MALRQLFGRIFGGEQARLRDALSVAEAARKRAGVALAMARASGDSRAIHYRDAAYRAATMTSLRAEIALRAVKKPRRRPGERLGAISGSPR